MTVRKTNKGFCPALVAVVAYLVFLASSAPHRVHHLFDTGSQSRAGEKHAAKAPAHHSHHREHAHHHEHADGSHGHSGGQTGDETTPANDCQLLAAFEQHPSSMAEPVFHEAIQHAASYCVESVPSLRALKRAGAQRTRSPPHSV